MSIQSINPYNNQLLKEYEPLNTDQINAAIEKGHQAYLSWKKNDFEVRAGLMQQTARILKERKSELAELITKEMGKIRAESEAEIEKCALVCQYYAENAAKFLKDEPLPVDDGEAFIAYDPIGLVLAVMPWNFPFWQVFRFAAPNLMAGNVGLLKHASNVPQCAKAIEEVFIQAGFPEGIFQSLMIGSSEVNEVIDHPLVKAVTLTGSDVAGKKVAERAGHNLKKTVLELGGSDPFIVLADADLEKAAQTAVKARMINCGQSCIAAKRFIIEKAVSDQFHNLFKQKMQNLKPGNPLDEGVDYGPMARRDLANQLSEQVHHSIDMGAELILGDGKPEAEGNFFHPAIITNIKPGMPAYQEELFGPVAITFVADGAEDAVQIANSSPFGLGAAVWSKDTDKAKRLARKIESGNVFINGMVASNPKTPFGGVKISGYGRELSYMGIREFMNIKTVWLK
ncbi:MAG: NAD-dependent succinate-semialdehyde dehydrogenase [Candidatus Cyclobacteriaceae bacterium M3_2C_046]